MAEYYQSRFWDGTRTQHECSKQRVMKYEKKLEQYNAYGTHGKWTLVHVCHAQAFIQGPAFIGFTA